MWERARRKEAGRLKAWGVRGVDGGEEWWWGERFAVQILASKIWTAPGEPGRGAIKGPPTPSVPTFLILPPLSPTQDAAGPPGPLCADSAARLRLAGASVREDPGRAGPPGTSCAVGAPAGPPQARAARPRPRAPLRPHPSQDQGASGGVSSRSGGSSASLSGEVVWGAFVSSTAEL